MPNSSNDFTICPRCRKAVITTGEHHCVVGPNTLLAYIRKSRIENEDTPSPARQRSTIEHWNAENGNFDLEWYQDTDISGHTAQRPGWIALLNRIGDHDVIGIIAEDQSRIFRNRTEMGNLRQTLNRCNRQLFLVRQHGISDKTAGGRMLLGIQAEVDEFWSAISSEKLRDTFHYLINDEGRHCGPVPFGCDRDTHTKHLIPTEKIFLLNPTTGQAQRVDLEDSEIVPPDGWQVRRYIDSLRFIFHMYAGGKYSPWDVAQLANGAGWRIWRKDRNTPIKLSRQHVRQILQQWQLYAGELPPGQRSNRQIVLPGGHDPILPTELCYRVNQAMEFRQNIRNPGNIEHESRLYPLTGILFCAHCGASLGGSRTTTRRGDKVYKYHYYRHVHYADTCPIIGCALPATALENEIFERILLIIQQPSLINNILDEARKALQPETAETICQLNRKQQEMERLIDLEVSGVITKEQFSSRYDNIKATIRQLENKDNGIGIGSLVEIENYLIGLADAIPLLPKASPYLKREIVQNILIRVEIDSEKKITIVEAHPWIASLFA